jgi:ATP/maltotriose-dependent transcriptional regulator MalT
MVDSTREKAISSPLLETKLFIPRPRPGLVSRPRLIERLNQASAGKLILVSAPAGFGKTTLLAEWLATAQAGKLPAAWLALDQSDNEPALFWSYLIAALQTVRPERSGGQPLAARRGQQLGAATSDLYQYRQCMQPDVGTGGRSRPRARNRGYR